MSKHAVAVIGGGVIGVSSAYHLAQHGAKVYLITAAALASGASGRSLSWINGAGIRSEYYHQFRMVGIDRYHTLFAGRPQLAAATYGIGPKPIPGDGEPVLGQLGDIGGLYVAFTHSGATLALIIGELLAYEIMAGRSHPLLAPFAASRVGAG